MTPPAAVICPPARYGQPWTPAATSVGEGGSGDQKNHSRALRDPHSPLLDSPRGWGRPFIREMPRPGDQLFPGSAGLGGGLHTWPGVSDIGRGQSGWINASHALDILRLG